MALTSRQKNIVNPGASIAAPNYSFDNERNKWVLEVIHKTYLWTNYFLQIGKELEVGVGPITAENNIITLEDAQAYIAVYPQNATLVERSGTSLPLLSQLSVQDANLKIKFIASLRDGINNILTVTTEESKDPTKQAPDGAEPTTSDQKAAQIPAFISKTDKRRDELIIKSAGLDPLEVSGNSIDEPIEDQKVNANLEQPGNIDFSDWTKNVTPDKLLPTRSSVSFAEAVTAVQIDGEGGRRGFCYYNPYDFKFYFVARSFCKNPKSFDITLRSNSAAVENNFRLLQTHAIRSILTFTGRFSEDNAAEVIADISVDATYGDSGRQIPPGGTAFWLLVGSISRAVIERLPPSSAIQDLPFAAFVVNNLTETPKAYRRAAFTIEKMTENIKKASRVIADYNLVLEENGITNDMLGNLNLSTEKQYLDSFVPRILDYFNLIPETFSPEKAIELVFDQGFNLEWITIEGKVYVDENQFKAFKGVSSRTFGYVFYSSEIAKLENAHPTKERPSWSEFLSLYTYEMPPINPAEIEAKISKNKKDGKKQAKKDSDSIFKTSEQVAKIISNTITKKDLTNKVNSALGSCGTGQAAILKDAIRLYTLMTGKTDTKALIILVANELRDELIQDAVLNNKLDEVAYAAQRPDIILKKIEQEVNEQLYCLFDLLGASIQKQFLDPAGVPPPVKALVRKAARPPTGARFTKTPTSDFFKAWRKQLEKLIVGFIKKIILDMFRDLVSAALGCGPQDEQGNVQSSPKSKKGTYGAVQINDLIEVAGDINLISLAEDLALVDTTIDLESRKKILKTPSEEQIKQMNDDISNFCTEKEILALLQGDAGDPLLSLINEMIYDSPVDLSGLSEQDKLNNIILNQRKESFASGDTRYASINLSVPNIEIYLHELGNLLGPDTLDEVVEKLTNEDYCGPTDAVFPGVSLDAFGISPDQLSRQLDQQYNAKLEKIKTLCDLSADLNLDLQIQDFWRNLENPAWYTTFLKWISGISNSLYDAIAEAMTAGANGQAIDNAPPSYQNTLMWIESGRREEYSSYPTWRIELVEDGQDNVDFYPDRGGVVWKVGDLRFRKNRRSGLVTDSSGNELARITFARTNRVNSTPGDAFSSTYTLRDLSDAKGQPRPAALGGAQIPNLISNSAVEVINTIVSFSNDYAFGSTIGADDWSTIRSKSNSSSEQRRLRRVSMLINNAGLNYRRLAVWFFTFGTYLDRLPEFLRQVNKPVFTPNLDKCASPRDEAIAIAVLNGIQKRIGRFMTNAAATHSAYFWGQPDTIAVLASYLKNKFKAELLENGAYGFYLQGTDSVVVAFGKQRTAGEIVLNFPSDIIGNGEKQFEYIISQLMKKMLSNITISGYTNNQSVFDIEEQEGAWLNAGTLFKNNSAIENGRDRGEVLTRTTPAPGGNIGTSAGSINLVVNNRDDIQPESKEYFLFSRPSYGHDNFEGPQIEDFLMALNPYPVLTAMQIIKMDNEIKPTTLIRSTDFNFEKTIAIADDIVISAINERHITRLSVRYERFPKTINGAIYYFPEELDEDIAKLTEMKQAVAELTELRSNLVTAFQAIEPTLLIAENEYHQNDRFSNLESTIAMPLSGFEQQPKDSSENPFILSHFQGGVGLREIYNSFALLFKNRIAGRIPGVFGEGENYFTPGDGFVEDAFSGWVTPAQIKPNEFLFGHSDRRDEPQDQRIDQLIEYFTDNIINASNYALQNERYEEPRQLGLGEEEPFTQRRTDTTSELIQEIAQGLVDTVPNIVNYHVKLSLFVKKYMQIGKMGNGRSRLESEFYVREGFSRSPAGSYKQDLGWLGKIQYRNAPLRWVLFSDIDTPNIFTEEAIQAYLDKLTVFREDL